MGKATESGFTLYELLVTMLVAGVIFGLGVPNLLEFTRNNQMTAAANDLLTSVLMARSEAVNLRRPVTLCASPAPFDEAPVCSADGAGTNGGYIVWADADSDAAVDAGEDILLQTEAPEQISIYSSNGYINFSPSGFVNDIPGLGLSIRLLLLCDERGNVPVSGSLSAARALRIQPTGRGMVVNEVEQIGPVVEALSAPCP